MEELCWMNGTIAPLRDARVAVEDRGFVFADGVYEVLRVYAGRVFRVWDHLTRLERSCRGIELLLQYSPTEIEFAIHDLVKKSELSDGIVYLQATRGVAPRYASFPKNTSPTLLMFTRAMAFTPQSRGQKVISVADDRWKRCWIKSVALLPNVLAKNAADRAGADEAIFVEDGFINEGATSNVMLIHGDVLSTTPPGPKVLPGVTRDVLLPLARQIGMKVEERAIRCEEMQTADEAFLTSTTREAAWISQWDERFFGDGTIGPWTRRLAEAFRIFTSADRR